MDHEFLNASGEVGDFYYSGHVFTEFLETIIGRMSYFTFDCSRDPAAFLMT